MAFLYNDTKYYCLKNDYYMIYLKKGIKMNINIDNNYYFEIVHDAKDCNSSPIDIKTISLRAAKKNQYLLLLIDFKTIKEKEYKSLLKKLLFVRNLIKLKHIEIGITKKTKKCIGYLINYDKNNKLQNDFLSGINAILYETRYERYNCIYDTVCNDLDSCFYGKNICDFKDNQCGEKRGTSSLVGCCRHYKYIVFGRSLNTCEHLTKDYKCGAKCISCKLFTCDYLNKKEIKFKIKDFLLLNTFFNSIQKVIIKGMLFTPKEKILKLLLMT